MLLTIKGVIIWTKFTPEGWTFIPLLLSLVGTKRKSCHPCGPSFLTLSYSHPMRFKLIWRDLFWVNFWKYGLESPWENLDTLLSPMEEEECGRAWRTRTSMRHDCLTWKKLKKWTYAVNSIFHARVILRYFRSTKNGAPFSHIHGRVRSLNLW